MKRITDWVHDGLKSLLQPGDWAVDATLGNGHDTEVLLQAVSASGRVFGFDVQDEAIAGARERFAKHVHFEPFLRDHAQMGHCLPQDAESRLSAVVFNLGYLPGSDHAQSTQPTSTLEALAFSLQWLASGGVLCCTCYPGTPTGAQEAAAVLEWATALERNRVHLTRIESLATRDPGPFVLWIEKR